MRLHPADRAKLIDALYASLESSEMQAIEKAWAQEAEYRLDAFRDGKIDSQSWDDLKENLRKDKAVIAAVMDLRRNPTNWEDLLK